jgi:hypothetical protein
MRAHRTYKIKMTDREVIDAYRIEKGGNRNPPIAMLHKKPQAPSPAPPPKVYRGNA